MDQMNVLVLPENLRTKLGNEAAQELAEVLNAVAADAHERTLAVVSERFERRLVEEIAGIKSHIAEVATGLRAEIARETSGLKSHIAEVATGLRAEITGETSGLRTQIAEVKADLIKWMFLFWIGQAATVLGILQLTR